MKKIDASSAKQKQGLRSMLMQLGFLEAALLFFYFFTQARSPLVLWLAGAVMCVAVLQILVPSWPATNQPPLWKWNTSVWKMSLLLVLLLVLFLFTSPITPTVLQPIITVLFILSIPLLYLFRMSQYKYVYGRSWKTIVLALPIAAAILVYTLYWVGKN